MANINIIQFDKISQSDLIVDAVYEAGKTKNIQDEVLSKLAHVGNAGGFRKCQIRLNGRKTKNTAYAE